MGRPGPSSSHLMGRGPAQPIAFSKIHGPARPGPTHDIDGETHEARALYGLARHFCGTARGFDGPGHGPALVLSRTKKCESICVDVFFCCTCTAVTGL